MTETTTDAATKVEEAVDLYLALRARKKKIEDRHEEELAPVNEKLNSLTTWLQDFLESNGAQSIKTKHGTAHTTTRYTASLADPQAFMNYVIENSAFDLLDRKANSTAVRDFVEANKAPPPGVNLSAIRTVNVRKPTGK